VDHFEENGCLYLVTEKIEGESLASFKRRGERLNPEEVARFLSDTSAILEYLHTRSPPVIHRDIKPSNVIKRVDGSFALVDFGAVRDRLKPEGGSTVVGTFGFMAPEQFQGRALPASDVYSVGATALSVLTAQDPEQLPHRGLAIDVQAALGEHAPPALVHVLERMLEPDPDRRASSITTLLNELGDEKGRGHSKRRTKRRQRVVHDVRSQRHFRLHPLVASFVLLGLMIATIATWWLFEFLLPLVLSIASIFVGPKAHRAAHHLREVGRQGRRGISIARRRILEKMHGPPDAASHGWQPPRERVRVPMDAEFEELDDLEPESEHRDRSPSRRS
jgi:serine/threonine protein kinase